MESLEDRIKAILCRINSNMDKQLPFSELCVIAREADLVGLDMDKENPGDSAKLAVAFHPLYLTWEQTANKESILKAAKESQFGPGLVSIVLYTNLFGTAEILGEKTKDVDFLLDLLPYAPSKGIKNELSDSLTKISAGR